MISLSSSDTTKRIAVGLHVANSTRLPYIDSSASQWIPRHAADFIQDPRP